MFVKGNITFVDMRKAFDSVPLYKIRPILDKSGISKRYINAIKTMYRVNKAIVQIRNCTSDSF